MRDFSQSNPIQSDRICFFTLRLHKLLNLVCLIIAIIITIIITIIYLSFFFFLFFASVYYSYSVLCLLSSSIYYAPACLAH